jgi:hypothetical protein
MVLVGNLERRRYFPLSMIMFWRGSDIQVGVFSSTGLSCCATECDGMVMKSVITGDYRQW